MFLDEVDLFQILFWQSRPITIFYLCGLVMGWGVGQNKLKQTWENRLIRFDLNSNNVQKELQMRWYFCLTEIC